MSTRIIDASELHTACESNCPARPCVDCLRSYKCDSFLIYRKEHPEYDVKYTSFVAQQKEQIKLVEAELSKRRSLCGSDRREQVHQSDSRHKEDEEHHLMCSNKIYGRRTKNMKLDFSEVKELESKQAAEGEQELTINKAVLKKSANGDMMLVLDMKDAEEGFTRDNVMLEGAGAFKAQQLIAALGISEEEFTNMEPTDLVGLTLVAEIIKEEYEGKSYSKVKKYIAA